MNAILFDTAAAINRQLTAEECEMLVAAREKLKHEYSYKAAAVRLGFTVSTVAQYAKRGLLKKTRRGHVSAASVNAFLLARSSRGGAGLREVSVRKERPVRVMAPSLPTDMPREHSSSSSLSNSLTHTTI